MRHKLTAEENRRGGKISGLVRAANASGIDRQELSDAAWLVANSDHGHVGNEETIERRLAHMKRDDPEGFLSFLWRALRHRRR